MAASASSAGDPFDLRKLRRLAELMAEHGLSEVDLRQADTRVRLRRPTTGDPTLAEARPAAASAASRPAAPPSAAPPPADAKMALIKSPMVGTFYVSPSPDAKPFVRVGDHIGPESTVCIIEAMKVFNEIPAETSGKIVAVLVENGEPVEFGQPLFKVDQSQ